MKERRTIVLNFRVGDAIRDVCSGAIEASGLTEAEWVRAVLALAATRGEFRPDTTAVEAAAGQAYLVLRATPTFKAICESAAEDAGLPLATWARAVLVRAASERAFVPVKGGRADARKPKTPVVAKTPRRR